MNKLLHSAMALALCGAIVPTSYTLATKHEAPTVTPAPAANISLQDLAAGKDYNFDLNQDGTEEKLSYKLEDSNFIVTINDEEALKLELDESYYDACLQIMDINTSTPGLDLFAYGICCSDDIGFGSLYQYEEGSLKEIWTCEYEDIESTKAFAGGTGYVVATDGNGQFTLKMDRPIYVDCLVGNHWEAVDYKLEDGKVSLVNTDTFDIIATMGSIEDTPDHAKNVYALVPDHDLKLYKQAGDEDGYFTVPAGTSLYPKTINIAKADSEGIYVSFETDNKMSGWLCTSDYDFDNLPFGNMWFAD